MQAQYCFKYLNMMDQWLILKQEGKNLKRYFEKNELYEIAIYGMSIYARHLIRELENSKIKIAYGIDKQRIDEFRGIPVFQLSKGLKQVDVIVNTVLWDHQNIRLDIENNTKCRVVSLEEVVFDSYD